MIKHVIAKKVNDKWMVICPECGTEFEIDEPSDQGYTIETCPECGRKCTPTKGKD